MISRTAFLLALLASLWLSALASAKSIELLTAAQGDTYVIGVVEADDTREHTTSSVRQRVDVEGQHWEEVAAFRSRLVSLAIAEGRVATLTDDGHWRLDSAILGQPLPAGKIERLVTADDGLIAVGLVPRDAGHPPVRTLWRWNGSVWHRIVDLPDAGEAPPQVVTSAGTIYVAQKAGDYLDIVSFAKGKWSEIAVRPSAGSVLLTVPGGYATIERRDNAIHFIRGDRDTALDATGYDAGLTAQAVGPTLRLLKANDKAVSQLTYDIDTGRRASGPDRVAQIAVPPPPTSVWSQFGLMILLAAAVMLTMRQSPVPPPEWLAKSNIQIAPLGGRFIAGMIDAVPCAAGFVVSFSMIADNEITIDRSFLSITPSLIGLTVYIAHTAITEAIIGRSLGKVLLGLRVIGYDGASPDVPRLILRNVLRVLDIAMMIPLLLVFLSPTRQRIGDLAAGTLVVRQTASTTVEPVDPPANERPD